MQDLAELADRLLRRRMELGHSQRAAAEAMGVSTNTVGDWELAAAYPRPKNAKAVAEYLDVPLDDFVAAIQKQRIERRESGAEAE